MQVGNPTVKVKKLYSFYQNYGVMQTCIKVSSVIRRLLLQRFITSDLNSFVLDSLDVSGLTELEKFANCEFRSFGYPVAQYVHDFDKGGLEQFVLDLSLQFQKSGTPSIIFYSGLPGKLKLIAEANGITCLKVSSASFFREIVISTKTKTLLIHHSYEHLEELSSSPINIVEVVHNPYWWQVNNTWLEDLRTRINQFVSVSKYVTNYLNTQLGVPNEKILTIQNFQQRIKHEKSSTQIAKKYTFVHIGNLDPQKNHLLLIKAFGFIKKNYLPESTLLLLHAPKKGSKISTSLKKLIQDLELENSVTIAYAPNPDSLAGYLRESQIFVLPSTFEGYSLATLEAMSFELPLVLTPCGGYQEVKDFGYPIVVAEEIIPEAERLNADTILDLSKNPNDENSRKLAQSMLEAVSKYSQFVFPDSKRIAEYVAGDRRIVKYLELVDRK